MKAIHVKSVDEATLDRLKRLARRHHRSLQGELRVILERAARMAEPEEEDDDLSIVTVEVGGENTWRREEMYGAYGR
jgi:plasmid stability protein